MSEVTIELYGEYEGHPLLIAHGEPSHMGQTEQEIEDALMPLLDYWGQAPQRQVRCLLGIADIVTKDAIYEIKYALNRQTIFQALGQVLLYRACLCPSAQPILVGHIIEDIQAFQDVLHSLDVLVRRWPHDFGLL